ncbi:MAG: hypothetical protein V4450_08445 [Bacteroidota bacterium]
MKTILVSLFSLFIVTCFAQQKPMDKAGSTATAVQKEKQVQNAAAWACPKCYAITKEGGQCANCKMDKVQLGTYYCTHCMKGTGAKAGKCPTCSMATTQMTRKLCAEHTKGATMKKAV